MIKKRNSFQFIGVLAGFVSIILALTFIFKGIYSLDLASDIWLFMVVVTLVSVVVSALVWRNKSMSNLLDNLEFASERSGDTYFETNKIDPNTDTEKV